MAKMLQVRNLPDDVHAALVARASAAGMTLSEYVGRQLRRLAQAPTYEELVRRAAERGTRMSLSDAADLVRGERDARS